MIDLLGYPFDFFQFSGNRDKNILRLKALSMQLDAILISSLVESRLHLIEQCRNSALTRDNI